jgi:hypothetical protein
MVPIIPIKFIEIALVDKLKNKNHLRTMTLTKIIKLENPDDMHN